MGSTKKQNNHVHLEIWPNLAQLLDRSPEETVLLIAPPSRWDRIFPNVVHWEYVSENSSCHVLFGLILYHADCATSRSRLLIDLKIIKSLIRPGGTLLFFGRNFLSFTKLKRLKKSDWKSFFSQPRFSLLGYKKALKDSGFLGNQGYIVLPNLETPDEIVSVDSPLIEVACNCHLLLRLAHRFKFFKYITDGYLFIASCNFVEDTPLLKKVETHLREKGHIKSIHCRLERFDLRIRGAMVLFLSENISGSYFIVRVVNDSKTQVIVRRNEQFILWLLSKQSLNNNIKQQLPDPITRFKFTDSTIFIETMMNGVLAWKANVSSLREVIFKGCCDFIYQLQQGTKCKKAIDQNLFHELFSHVLTRLELCNEVDRSFLHDIVELVKFLEEKMIGQVYIFTASHGDYGYGNILINPRSGKLIGVIDWDTGRKLELAGLDLFNLLVQRSRTEKGYGVFQAFTSVIPDILTRNSLDIAGKYYREFGISGNVLKILLYVGLLRYVSRSAQYPKVYNTEEEDYIKTLHFLKTKIPL